MASELLRLIWPKLPGRIWLSFALGVTGRLLGEKVELGTYIEAALFNFLTGLTSFSGEELSDP
jgi:hypothetical protein